MAYDYGKIGPCEICEEEIEPESKWKEGDTGDICEECWEEAEAEQDL